jgi:ApeA N-terminal domain 1
MLESREYKGLWWLPGDDEEALSGTAVVAEGRTELEVVGDFGRALLSESAREKSYSLDLEDKARVLGMAANGKEVTLEGLVETGHKVHLPGLVTARYESDVAIVGRHFPASEDVTFDEISICASDLNSWTRVSGFDISMGFEELKEKGGTALSSTEIRYEAPDDIHIPLARGESATIRFTAPSKGLGPGTDHVELSQKAALHLRFATRGDIRTVVERVSQVRNFLSLAVGRPISILSVTGYRDDYTQGNTSFPRPIEIYWQIPHNPKPPARRRYVREMLFTLDETQPEISAVMRKWFRRQPHLEPVFNLFFGTLYNPGLYLEVKFLAYAQAIETYDYRRRRKPGKLALAQRMRDVLGQCRTVTRRIVGEGGDDLDAFIRGFKDSRNYYTHYNPKLEARAATGTSLLLLCIQLQAIIEMSLLRELGFQCRAINGMLERSRRYAEIEHFRSMVSREAA